VTEVVVPPVIEKSSAPAYTLHDPLTVGIATFLGSPLAGVGIIALNYKRLGEKRKAWLTILIGVMATAVLLTIAMLLPEGPWATGLGIGALMATVKTARALQGPALEDHTQRGGRIGSRWMAAGMGLLGILVVGLGVVVWAVLSPALPGTRVVIGQKDEIFYSGAATETDARSLGKALIDAHFFVDRGVSVQLVKDDKGTTIGLVVQDGIWNDEKSIRYMRMLIREIAPSVGGMPIKLRLLDDAGDVKKEETVDKWGDLPEV